MSSVEIVTPNHRRCRARANSWYVLHIMTWQRSGGYNSLNPEAHAMNDGSTRYLVRLPVLLSSASTEDDDVFMDVCDVFRCYDIPYSRYLRIQMFLDGKEADPPSGHAVPIIESNLIRKDSWYLLSLTESEADDYERLDPVYYRMVDGSMRYKVRVPVLYRTPDKQSLMDLSETCKYLNIPDFRFYHFEMYIDGVEVEHPFNKKEKRTYALPSGGYYLGDPLAVLGDVEDFFEVFLGAHDCEENFCYRGYQIVGIYSGVDGFYPLFKRNQTIDSIESAGKLVHVDSLSAELARLSFIPLDLLDCLGTDQDVIEDNGFILDAEPPFTDSIDETFAVTIHSRGGIVTHVEFLQYLLLLQDRLALPGVTD